MYNTLLICTALQCTIHYWSALHYNVPNLTALHCTTIYNQLLHCTTQDRPYWSLGGVCRRHCCKNARGNWGKVQGELFRQICAAGIFWFHLTFILSINFTVQSECIHNCTFLHPSLTEIVSLYHCLIARHYHFITLFYSTMPRCGSFFKKRTDVMLLKLVGEKLMTRIHKRKLVWWYGG